MCVVWTRCAFWCALVISKISKTYSQELVDYLCAAPTCLSLTPFGDVGLSVGVMAKMDAYVDVELEAELEVINDLRLWEGLVRTVLSANKI